MSFKFFLLCGLVLLTSCSLDFENVYSKIREDRVRVLELITLTPDNAPGQEVTFQAHFGGKQFDPTTIEWRVSWQVLNTPFSSDAINEEDLAPYMTVPPTIIRTDSATTVVEFTFQIPDSIIVNNPGIPENWGDLVSYYIPEFDPAIIGLPSTTDSMVALLDSVARLTPAEQAAMPREVGRMLNMVSQILTVQYDIYAEIPDVPFIRQRYATRYHSLMADVDGIYMNNAPTIDSIVLMKSAKDDIDNFNPANGTHASYPLRNDTLTIPLRGDSAYWLGVYVTQPDSSLTFEAALDNQSEGIATLEKYGQHFFYDSLTYETINFYSWQGLFDDSGFNYFRVDIDSSVTVGQEGFIWLTILDDKPGVANRQKGRFMQAIPLVVE